MKTAEKAMKYSRVKTARDRHRTDRTEQYSSMELDRTEQYSSMELKKEYSLKVSRTEGD